MPNYEFAVELDASMELSEAPDGLRSAAVAISNRGELYPGSYFGSQTKLLSVAAEVVSLAQAARFWDYSVNKVIALYECADQRTDIVSPAIIQSVIDFAARTGSTVEYLAIDARGEELIHSQDVMAMFPFYKPNLLIPHYIEDRQPREYKERTVTLTAAETELFELARESMDLAFTSTDKDTRYGAVVTTGSSKAYQAGQLSNLGGRTIHAEMCAVLAAKMDGESEIDQISLISSKFIERPSGVCGNCQQFLSEHVDANNLRVSRYSLDGNTVDSNLLVELLPDAWTSKT